MALLALALALLAIPVATTAKEVRPLDMAWDSFDDQYRGCGPAMEAELPALNHSEFQNNSLFARVWPEAVDRWQRQGSPLSPLSSSAQAIAIMSYTMVHLQNEFNEEVRVAGRSPQEYRDNFHFKTLHFLLTDALATLRAAQKEQKCHVAFWAVGHMRYKARNGDIVRFGHFLSSSTRKSSAVIFGNTTVFQVQTCHGADIKKFSAYPSLDDVLIPPFEKFKVTKVIEKGKKVEIHLDSIGTYSKYNCEWLTGWSIPSTEDSIWPPQPSQWPLAFSESQSPQDHQDLCSHCGHHDHQEPQDSQRNEATKATKATTATMVALATMASMWSLWSSLAL